jgi:hypothetical protein
MIFGMAVDGIAESAPLHVGPCAWRDASLLSLSDKRFQGLFLRIASTVEPMNVVTVSSCTLGVHKLKANA